MTAAPRVLLVEDNPGDADLVRQVFDEGPHAVELSVIGRGEQAVALLVAPAPARAGAPRPDLVLLDLSLPGISGLDVLAEMRRHAELRTLPVVVMSASAASADIAASYELGSRCYVHKPSGLEDFENAVRSVRDFWLGTATLP